MFNSTLTPQEPNPKAIVMTETGECRPLRVVFLSSSDDLGGAAIVTRRLMHALVGEGVDAKMIAFNKITDDPLVESAKNGRQRRGFSFVAERTKIFLKNGLSYKNLFKVSTASNGIRLDKKELVRDADIIVLSWINQGLLSLEGIKQLAALGKPIVWVMHDMWNMTGICHHAYECERYTQECGRCMFLNSNHQNDLSHETWLAKKALYDAVPIHFVAVSNWLAECARKSSLLKDRDVRVIHNAFPIGSFYTEPTINIPSIPQNKKVIVMGAARLDDPIKGFDMAVSSLNYVFDNYPEVARETVAVFFGGFRRTDKLDALRFPHIELGVVTDGTILRDIYARASVIISTSLYETLPGTLIEGQAAGALPVTFGMGGQSDIVEHKVNGYIARYKDTADFGEGIVWGMKHHHDRQKLHDHVSRRFSSQLVAGRFLDLFRELLDSGEKKQ